MDKPKPSPSVLGLWLVALCGLLVWAGGSCVPSESCAKDGDCAGLRKVCFLARCRQCVQDSDCAGGSCQGYACKGSSDSGPAKGREPIKEKAHEEKPDAGEPKDDAPTEGGISPESKDP